MNFLPIYLTTLTKHNHGPMTYSVFPSRLNALPVSLDTKVVVVLQDSCSLAANNFFQRFRLVGGSVVGMCLIADGASFGGRFDFFNGRDSFVLLARWNHVVFLQGGAHSTRNDARDEETDDRKNKRRRSSAQLAFILVDSAKQIVLQNDGVVATEIAVEHQKDEAGKGRADEDPAATNRVVQGWRVLQTNTCVQEDAKEDGDGPADSLEHDCGPPLRVQVGIVEELLTIVLEKDLPLFKVDFYNLKRAVEKDAGLKVREGRLRETWFDGEGSAPGSGKE